VSETHPAHAPAAIEVAGLRKSFAARKGGERSGGEKVVLDGVDFRVEPGTIYALLGPNGAGKTTTVHILSTLIEADAGDLRIAGHDVRRQPEAVRATIGVTGQFSAVDGLLTGEENLRLMADLAHLGSAEAKRRTAELLERFDLGEAARKPATTYSGGMKRRLDLAMTLVGRPSVIFLDEPTTGLDPRARREAWAVVGELVAEGVTILLTTQYLDEADHLAHRIGVLDNGSIMAEGTADELKRMIPGGHVLLRFADERALGSAAALVGPGATRDDNALTLTVPSDGGVASLRHLLDRLDGTAVDSLTLNQPDLDDVFLALTAHPDRAVTHETHHDLKESVR
jgi:ABC-2 type transport system ATP-binding protein